MGCAAHRHKRASMRGRAWNGARASCPRDASSRRRAAAWRSLWDPFRVRSFRRICQGVCASLRPPATRWHASGMRKGPDRSRVAATRPARAPVPHQKAPGPTREATNPGNAGVRPGAFSKTRVGSGGRWLDGWHPPCRDRRGRRSHTEKHSDPFSILRQGDRRGRRSHTGLVPQWAAPPPHHARTFAVARARRGGVAHHPAPLRGPSRPRGAIP